MSSQAVQTTTPYGAAPLPDIPSNLLSSMVQLSICKVIMPPFSLLYQGVAERVWPTRHVCFSGLTQGAANGDRHEALLLLEKQGRP